MATENPRVGTVRGPRARIGLIPPLGTIPIVFQTVTLWVARGLSEFVSMGVGMVFTSASLWPIYGYLNVFTA